MSIIRIRTKRDTRAICGKLVGPKSWTKIDAEAFEAFAETRMGKIIIENCIEFSSDDKTLKGRDSAEQAAIKSDRKADKEKITILESENSGLKKKIKELEFALTAGEGNIPEILEEPGAGPEISGDFVFDPEQHTIEHRGRGKYFVMDVDDNKVYGPVTEEEKAQFESMMDGE